MHILGWRLLALAVSIGTVVAHFTLGRWHPVTSGLHVVFLAVWLVVAWLTWRDRR